MAMSLPVFLVIVLALFLLGLLITLGVGGRRGKKPQPGVVTRLAPTLSPQQQLAELVEKGGNARVLIEGGFRLRDGFVSPSGFTVRGALILEDDSMLDGPVEVFGNAHVGVRARSVRPLYVHGDLTLGKDSRVPCCHVEGNVFFHPGAKVEGALHCNAVYLVESPLEAEASADPVAVDASQLTTGV